MHVQYARDQQTTARADRGLRGMCERMRMQLTVLASRQIALANRLSGVDVTIFKSIDFP